MIIEYFNNVFNVDIKCNFVKQTFNKILTKLFYCISCKEELIGLRYCHASVLWLLFDNFLKTHIPDGDSMGTNLRFNFFLQFQDCNIFKTLSSREQLTGVYKQQRLVRVSCSASKTKAKPYHLSGK